MMRPLLLMLMLIASPAWADPIPVLSGTWDFPSTGLFRINVTTAEFTFFADNDGHERGIYQGVEYCSQNGNTCTLTSVCCGTIFTNVGVGTLHAVPPSFCTGFCEPVPATLTGRVTFFGAASFEYFGEGVALSRDGIFYHADFGSSATQTPEPSTWLLLLTGLLFMALSVGRRRGPT